MGFEQKIDSLAKALVQALDENKKATELVAVRLKWLNDKLFPEGEFFLEVEKCQANATGAAAAAGPTGSDADSSTTSTTDAPAAASTADTGA